MAVQLQYSTRNLSQQPQIQLEYDRHIQAPYRIRAERTVMEAELLFDQERSLKCNKLLLSIVLVQLRWIKPR